jgi:hypothetical protein
VGIVMDMGAETLTDIGGAPTGEAFGAAVAVGDGNGDGVADLFVGNPDDAGEIVLFTGPLSGSVDLADGEVLLGTAAGMHFGADLAFVSDLGADGHDDLLVGAPGTADGVGGVAILTDAADPDTMEMIELGRGFPEGSLTGSVVVPVGDIDGDGIQDVAVGIPGQGAVAVLVEGVTGGVANGLVVIQSDAPGSELGRAIAGRRDLDGDGLSDLVVGAPRIPESGGSVFVFAAPTDGMVETDAYSRIDGPEAEAEAGTSVAAVGDINGDGYIDLTIGAPGLDDYTGSLEVVIGPVPTGVPATTNDVAYHLVGSSPGDLAGFATFAPGDINADGHADFIGSAVGDGRTWLYLGAPLF